MSAIPDPTLVVGGFLVWIVAGVLGWSFPKHWFWAWIDVFYYPLAALGVVLLFLSNDVPRERAETAERLKQQQRDLQDHSSKKPQLDLTDASQILARKVELIGVIAKWVEVCEPTVTDPDLKCFVVKRIKKPVQVFLKAADGKLPNYEERLLATCEAGNVMLESIRGSGSISSFVMEKYFDQWNAAIKEGLSPLAFNAIETHEKTFVANANSFAAVVQSAVAAPGSDSGRTIAKIHKAEIDYAAMLFSGLSQCITAPQAALKTRKEWADGASTREQVVAALQEKFAQLEKASTKNQSSERIQLFLWPYVLVVALALKFAKGVAGVSCTTKSKAVFPKHLSPTANKISPSAVLRKRASWRLAKRRAGESRVRPTRRLRR